MSDTPTDSNETQRRPRPPKYEQAPEPEKLPPHDAAVERHILAAILDDPEQAHQRVQLALEQFGDDQVFYDLKHQIIWSAMTYLHARKVKLDAITLGDELNARGQLDQIGGLAELGAMVAVCFSAYGLDEWIKIVWEKFVARQMIQQAIKEVQAIESTNGQLVESFVQTVDDRRKELRALLERGTPTPKNLCEPNEFHEAYLDAWFKRKEDDYGLHLPFEFPLRWRPSEMTLFTGDNGSGKSSMLGLIAIACGKQFKKDEKVVVASMEVPPEITLWIMARQLIGKKDLKDTEAGRKEADSALAWLQKRILIYNFLGITDWRELLNTFRYAREHQKGELFIVDSVMRIGIADDDYAMQGVAAAAYADFSVKTGAHTFLVVHENKGDGRAKDRVRGSKQWTDNAHNVVGMKRNEDKAAKMEDLKAELRARAITLEKYNEVVAGMATIWDSKFVLSKQRWPGSQQNASRWLYFNAESLQFHEAPNMAPFDYRL